jgi:hypothetical protein
MRRRIMLLLGLGFLALGAPACSDDDGGASTTTPSSEIAEDPAERLYGTWDVNAVGSHHTFEPDGTWYVVVAATGGDPYDFGTYTIEGSIVTLDTDTDAFECAQTTGSYEVTFVDADTISWELIDDDCAIRGANVPRALWERVEAE